MAQTSRIDRCRNGLDRAEKMLAHYGSQHFRRTRDYWKGELEKAQGGDAKSNPS